MNPHTVLQLAHILVLGPLLVVIGLGYADAWPMAIAGLGAFSRVGCVRNLGGWCE